MLWHEADDYGIIWHKRAAKAEEGTCFSAVKVPTTVLLQLPKNVPRVISVIQWNKVYCTLLSSDSQSKTGSNINFNYEQNEVITFIFLHK